MTIDGSVMLALEDERRRVRHFVECSDEMRANLMLLWGRTEAPLMRSSSLMLTSSPRTDTCEFANVKTWQCECAALRDVAYVLHADPDTRKRKLPSSARHGVWPKAHHRPTVEFHPTMLE